MPLGAERDDDSYLSFVEGLRVYTQAQVAPVAAERSKSAVAEFESAHGIQVKDLSTVRSALDPVPVIASRNRLMRSSQEMFWNEIIETYRKREPELLAELDRADRSGPGTVEYDPNFVYPDYFSKVEFHIQPGSYYADPLAGYIYHYGTKVFFTGKNDNDDVQRGLVNTIPTPADGQVRRILDLACSVGQSSTAFKERFPEAEVWGIDAGAPMVRYAHKRAADMRLDVHFAQRLAEKTGFPDDHFDIVYAMILFHEIPQNIAKEVIAEAHRVLRPGGLFVVLDFANRPRGVSNPIADYSRDFDTHDNGEPYASDFVYSDFHDQLRAKFRNVNENFSPQAFLPLRVAEK